MNRRTFLQAASTAVVASAIPVRAAEPNSQLGPVDKVENGFAVPDQGWTLWLDKAALWEQDELHLPDEVDLRNLPANPPTGGWHSLREQGKAISLPTTVEEHFWGTTGTRSYTPEEYRYAADDTSPQNGAYRGVSWWSTSLQIPAALAGKRILLDIRGARLRAEVYLNQQLVGYSIMEELPFTCDLTTAAKPGAANELAIRITNPGGRYDWVDGTTIRWGAVNIYRSHGFGGLDRGLRIRAVPMQGHLEDAWVLNRLETHTISAHARPSMQGEITFEVVDPESGVVLASAEAASAEGTDGVVAKDITVPSAKLWDLDTPKLYQLRTTMRLPSGKQDIRYTSFGFRSFAPEGIGSNAMFRLNGRRIKLYTSISWGFWGHNGLFPTPELAEREVLQAKRLNLNCLNFHRNVGKEEVFQAQDRLGLLRCMEPGGGKLSIGKLPDGVKVNSPGIVMVSANNDADRFSRRFALQKCKYMVRAYRSHPSLIQYTLQNEVGADLKRPESFEAIEMMHREDPSRSVVLNDGFTAPPRSAAQAWFAPYQNEMYRSDKISFGGWWDNHQGAGDQWYDRFYQNPRSFTYRQSLKGSLVEFGEMEGCAVPDNHSLMEHQISSRQFGGSGLSYDLNDHQEIDAAYSRFFQRWSFPEAFSVNRLYRSLGDKCYGSWQQYMENIRICDEVDLAAISGWESTSIENHSGIVDNLRNFKGDPDLIASTLLPIRPVVKQRSLCCQVGKAAVLDIYLLNDTGTQVQGNLRLEMLAPDNHLTLLKTWPAPPNKKDQFSYLVEEAFATDAFAKAGKYRFRLSCEGISGATCEREVWVASGAMPAGTRKLRVAFSSVIGSMKAHLAQLPEVEAVPFQPGEHYDVIVASGVVPGSTLDRQVGEETGLEDPPVAGIAGKDNVPGSLSEAVLTAVKAGTPLLAFIADDFLANGVAKQLADLGAFTYKGQVGDTRAPWMGNWLFVRDHPTFAGLPVNCALGVHYQAPGQKSNGLLIDRAAGSPDPEVIMGYGRDHDRNIGAASFVCRAGKTPVLVHRAPELNLPLQLRWLANTLHYLASA